MKGILAVGFVVLVLAGCGGNDPPSGGGDASPLRVRDGWFVDTAGRVVLLHGANVVYKRPPYLPSTEEFGAADADAMRDLGFNAVRLGFIWKGLEPDRGAIDRDHLRRYAEIVDLLASRGIHVLVDSHQDLWNERFGGEGAPDWAVFQPGVQPIGTWVLSYWLFPAVGNAYLDFWNDRESIQSEYLSVWRELATTFAGNAAVLGYDLMNEPFPGPDWNVPQESATTQPFYERFIPAIREIDPDHTIFWELALPHVLGVESDLGPLGFDNLALSFHVYCATSIFLRVYLPDYCDGATAPAFDQHRVYRDAQQGGWLLTEFGASDFVDDIAKHAEVADQNLVGWTHWAWKLYGDPTGDVNEAIVTSDTGPIDYKDKVAVLERAYARSIAGAPTSMSFDPRTGDFDLSYVPDPSIAAPTEIWLPLARFYANGYDAEVTGGTARASKSEARVLEVRSESGASSVSVSIRARTS